MFTFRSIAVVIAITLAIPATADDKKPEGKKTDKVVETQPTKGRGAGPDENIKSGRPTNTPDMKRAPTERAASGSAACAVILRNLSAYYLDIYVDGKFRGTLGPSEDGYTLTYAGTTRAYASAPGVDTTWGPSEFYCPVASTYTWRLLPPK